MNYGPNYSHLHNLDNTYREFVQFDVFAYPVPEGKSGQQVVDSLQRQVELLGAVKSGNFSVDCETYQSNLQNDMIFLTFSPQRLVHILHNTEQPATCFSILDTGTCLMADVMFEIFMNKLTHSKSAFYQQRKGFKIESKGQRYELGDFFIKIGSVSLMSNFKGILVEVEYCPCVILNDCWNLLKEFMQSFMGNIVEAPPPYLKNKADTPYAPSDTVHQYLEHFNNFRKTVPIGQPSR
ncbi:hypothetical protein ScPMuIL_007633 [Solemya velum]